MRFLVTVRHRTSKVKIYARARNFKYYRVSYAVAGERRTRTFSHYSEAKAAAERIAWEVSQGSQAAGLTARQSQDAIAGGNPPKLGSLVEVLSSESRSDISQRSELLPGEALCLGGSLAIENPAYWLAGCICPYHFALHSNENLTTAQAGNSPAMIHGHYKGLATNKEAEKLVRGGTESNAKVLIGQ